MCRGHDDRLVDEGGAADKVVDAVPLLEDGAHVRPLAELRRGVRGVRDAHADAVHVVPPAAGSAREDDDDERPGKFD